MAARKSQGSGQNRQALHLYAVVAYGDAYVQPLIESVLAMLLPRDGWTLLDPYSLVSTASPKVSLEALLPDPLARVLQITQYEDIDFAFAMAHSKTCLVNSFMIRKALIRKHFLSATVDNWVAKHPASVLQTHVKRTEAFELDYAEFLDDALVDAFDLRASMDRNAVMAARRDQSGPAMEWWILKPSMSDQGHGIRLFSSMAELQAIFDHWDAELEESDDEEQPDMLRERPSPATESPAGPGEAEAPNGGGRDTDAIVCSHLRHFVAQPYIHPPLLLDQLGNRKFHIRAYVLAVGSLRVYVYQDMLALFAAKPYQAPSSACADNEMRDPAGAPIDLDAHLTNTCRQGAETTAAADSVRRFWDLPLAAADAAAVFDQVCRVTGDLFEAAARGMVVAFQPLAHAFELYGLDFLVDAAGTAWLLEVNAFPDFAQTGPKLDRVVAELWVGVVRLVVGPFVGAGEEEADAAEERQEERQEEGGSRRCKTGAKGLILVREICLGSR